MSDSNINLNKPYIFTFFNETQIESNLNEYLNNYKAVNLTTEKKFPIEIENQRKLKQEQEKQRSCLDYDISAI